MIYYRCRCGKRESWGTFAPAPCDPCPECGVTLATNDLDHREPVPHDWLTSYVETDAGRQPVTRCGRCMVRQTEVLDDGGDGPTPEASAVAGAE